MQWPPKVRLDPTLNIGRFLVLLAMALAMAFFATMFPGEVVDLARRVGSLENVPNVERKDIKEMQKDLNALSKSLRDLEKSEAPKEK
jgi:hypothetical protein